MIPTIIEYIIILMCVAMLFIAGFPWGLYWLSKISFLGITVTGFWPSFFFIGLTVSFGSLFVTLLVYFFRKFITDQKIIYGLAVIVNFLSVWCADLIIKGVDIPLWIMVLYAFLKSLTGLKPQAIKKDND